MAKIEIYSKIYCSYCRRAKALLKAKGAAYEDYDITLGGSKRAEMIARAPGATTVPQIFINGQHIGGCDDIMALERRGALDPLLNAA